ncbi:hypothetical protein [Chitinophaga sp. S165]|uniref:hypothetical protein n=1 Tax=Chitinophaga sp. S165 TaxID=2135462 RepID=UPI000DA0E118|nr:hypothetical protein [Chitinophaga sp. S165]PWV55577.1 hypothetical protein C7475_10183 [Chitinophaga sp. S165]
MTQNKNKDSCQSDDIGSEYVVIGDNGGKDYWLLNAHDYSDANVYEWPHCPDGNVVKMGYDFQELLSHLRRE